MKIAVTGASGHLGGALVQRLVADRDTGTVLALDTLPPVMASGKIQPVEADLMGQDLRSSLEGCDSLVHVAPLGAEGSRRVFQAAAECGIRHLVFVSSSTVYSVPPDHQPPVEEDGPRFAHHDDSAIAAICAVEEFLDAFEPQHPHLAITRLRPVPILGPHMADPIGDLQRREPFPVQAVFQSDVVDAIVLALKGRMAGAFNLGAEDPRPIAEIAPAVATAWKGGPARFDCRPAALVSSRKARGDLGWRPRSPTVARVFQTYLDTAPRNSDKHIVWFLRIAGWSGRYGPRSPELQGVAITIQLELTGPGGDTFGLVVNNGRLSIVRRKLTTPLAIVTLKASLFRRILAGKTSWSKEQLTGKIQAIGQGHAPMVLTGIVATFRSSLGQPGVPGALVRLLASWIEAGA